MSVPFTQVSCAHYPLVFHFRLSACGDIAGIYESHPLPSCWDKPYLHGPGRAYLQHSIPILSYRTAHLHIPHIWSPAEQQKSELPSWFASMFRIISSVFSLVYMLRCPHQIAVSRPPTSIAVAIIGILTGQIYRSDLASLNTYRLPPSIVRFTVQLIGPIIGSLRPPRRSNRALPDEFRSGSPRSSDPGQQNDEVITTARTPRRGITSRNREGPSVAEQQPPAPSVMREWVDELTGRADQVNAGLRVPTETEITHVTTMFPTLEREVVVAALQRR